MDSAGLATHMGVPTLAVIALAVEVAGFAAAAALAALTEMPDQPKPQPSSPAKVPAPWPLPKLPQMAFNLEKRSSDLSRSDRRA